MRPEDWPACARIFEEGLELGTFEDAVPSWEAWDGAHLPRHRLVAEEAARVLGWAALSRVSERCCYRGVAENSIYMAEEARGRGVGQALLERLVADAEADGIWTIQTGIFPENELSIRLHERCGFRVVGVESGSGSSTANGETSS